MTYPVVDSPAHSDRTGAWKSGANDLIVLHTSEQVEDSNPYDDAESLAAYIRQPGDRPSTSRPGQFYGASYHAVFDTDRVFVCAPDNLVTYSAGGANHNGIHGCFPGKAGRSRAEWLDDDTREQIRVCAWWIVERARANDIPLRHLSVAEASAGARGIVDHDEVSRAFGKSNHWDVGPGFPWDVLFDDITTLTDTPPEEDDMETIDPGRWLGDPAPLALAAGQAVVLDAPFGALEFAVNFTVQGEGEGFVTVWGDGSKPDVSTVRVRNGFNDNRADVKTGSDGRVRIESTTACKVWADIQGLKR